MSQMMRAMRSPVVPVQGNTRKVDRSGRRYISDSSIRTNPSIDDPSNMILPSSASSNWRSGISTFLMMPRMSVNWRRMNFSFSRSARSRICAFVSLGFAAGGCAFAIREYYRSGVARFPRRPTFPHDGPSERQIEEKSMKTTTLVGAAAIVAMLGASVLRPFGSTARAESRQDDPREQFRRFPDQMVLAGRGAEIGIQVTDAKDGGVVIEEVLPDSPAEKAGLKRLDVIVEFDGERVRST